MLSYVEMAKRGANCEFIYCEVDVHIWQLQLVSLALNARLWKGVGRRANWEFFHNMFFLLEMIKIETFLWKCSYFDETCSGPGWNSWSNQEREPP